MNENSIDILCVYSDYSSMRTAFKAVLEMEDVRLVSNPVSTGLALARLKRAPVDLVLFDLENADADALDVLRKIRSNYPETGIVILIGTTFAGAQMTVSALEMGAVDFLAKPSDNESGMGSFRRQLRIITGMFRNRRNFRANVFKHEREAPEKSFDSRDAGTSRISTAGGERFASVPENTLKRGPGGAPPIKAVGIGVSAGGPNALVKVVPRLPSDLGVPVFVVQHMPPPFTSSLAESLDKRSALSVTEASHGLIASPGGVYIAPGGKHMGVRSIAGRQGRRGGVQIVLSDSPPENSCRPSVDFLFRSMAATYGVQCLVVVMTGMGADGLDGVRAVKNAGGRCLTQTESTCVVYGMPRAVDEAGLSDESTPLDQIAVRLARLARNSREQDR